MSFQDIMLKILPKLVDQDDEGITYVPYITRSGQIPNINDPFRSDYDDPRQNGTTIHGGVDIIYGEVENGTMKWIGSANQPKE